MCGVFDAKCGWQFPFFSCSSEMFARIYKLHNQSFLRNNCFGLTKQRQLASSPFLHRQRRFGHTKKKPLNVLLIEPLKLQSPTPDKCKLLPSLLTYVGTTRRHEYISQISEKFTCASVEKLDKQRTKKREQKQHRSELTNDKSAFPSIFRRASPVEALPSS